MSALWKRSYVALTRQIVAFNLIERQEIMFWNVTSLKCYKKSKQDLCQLKFVCVLAAIPFWFKNLKNLALFFIGDLKVILIEFEL